MRRPRPLSLVPARRDAGTPTARPGVSLEPHPPPVRWQRRVPCVTARTIGPLRREIAGLATRSGAPRQVSENIALAVSEALTNVVQHAYRDHSRGPVSACVQADAREFLVTVCDEGGGPTPRSDSPGLGLGIGLMSHLADTFSITARPGNRGTKVTMGFRLRNTEDADVSGPAPDERP